MSFLPRDAVELTLCGQTVLFNELLADGARDLLRGPEASKSRGRSSVINMGRLLQGHLDRLEKRGVEPHRTEFDAAREEVRPVAAKPVPAPAPAEVEIAAAVEPTPVIATPVPPSEPPAEAETAPPAAIAAADEQTPVAETSWLDAPFEQWVIETPAGLAAKAEVETNGAVPAAVVPDTAKPVLPRQPEGYLETRMLLDTARAIVDLRARADA
jgi:hypothetical protein